MGKVFITDYISNPDIERDILGSCLVDDATDDVEVLLVWHQKIDEAYIRQFPNLKGVVRYGVGFDGLDLEELKVRGIVACNTPDYGTSEVSDTALAMILNIVRGVSYYDRVARDLNDGTWQENVNISLRRSSDLTVGVVGAGRIGSALLRKAEFLGFKTAFFDPYREDGFEKIFQSTKRYDSLKDLLQSSDLVSIHVPLNDETKGMINKDFLGGMRTGASLINTARGGLIRDLDDVMEAIEFGRVYSVALDVLPEEPPDSDNCLIRAWKSGKYANRIIINPHTAYYSREAFVEMRTKAAMNAKRILEGKAPRYRLV